MQNDLKSKNLEELLVSYQECSVEAFDEFYRRTSLPLYNFIRKRLRSNSDADDVFQETFFRIHKYIATYDPSQAALTWIFTIARNAIIDRVKLNARLPHGNLAEIDGILARDLADSQMNFKELIQELFSDLPLSDQQLIFDRVLNDMNYADLGAKYDVSEVSARQRISRNLKKIRHKIQKKPQ